VHRVNGHFESAEGQYLEALDLARRHNAPGVEGEALTNLAETLCWIRPSAATDWAHQALTYNESIGNKVELVKAYVALAVSTVTPTAARDVPGQVLDTATTLAKAIGFQGGVVFAKVAEAFADAAHGELTRLPSHRQEINFITNQLGGNRFWLDVVDAWMGTTGETHANWLEGLEAARQRWGDVLARRQHA
jgi:hypothetical protein